jgi:hypothetical protein
MNHKLGIIVPYRNRLRHLIIFKKAIKDYLESKKINYELIIVEQDDGKTFNRGMLLNIGFLKAKHLKCDYVVFHDIDMLPVEVDYSYSEYPIHMATNFIPNDVRIIFDEYFGGVTLFPIDVFEKINGFSNEYWGWGFEDNDLLYRCVINYIDLDIKEIIQHGSSTAAIKFNGKNSFIKSESQLLKRNNDLITIFISFCPNELTLNYENYDDNFVVFSGNKFKIKYNCYQRYVVEIQDNSGEFSYINSTIKPPYKTNICVTINKNDKKISMYQDGVFVGEDLIKNDFEIDLTTFYLGCEENKNFFDGVVTSLAIFDTILNENEIKEISNNQFFGLTQSFGKYNSEDNLKIYYDAKFIKKDKMINISNPKYFGEINNCKIIGYVFENKKLIKIPHRRNSTFELLKHDENGFVNGSWKELTTRYNQLKYHNEVSKGHKKTKEDGLKNLRYKTHNTIKDNQLTQILVGI